MPSGRTHDAITFLLAVPAGAAAYAGIQNGPAALLVAVAFVFGGLMFGPDLDTVSRQYSRWAAFRFLWHPYRRFFRHRSRFSHGLIFGALIRVIYLLGVLSLVGFGGAYAYAAYRGGTVPATADLWRVWRSIAGYTYAVFGEHFFSLVFLGLWLGAASHTLTDVAGSFLKTGRVRGML